MYRRKDGVRSNYRRRKEIFKYNIIVLSYVYIKFFRIFYKFKLIIKNENLGCKNKL